MNYITVLMTKYIHIKHLNWITSKYLEQHQNISFYHYLGVCMIYLPLSGQIMPNICPFQPTVCTWTQIFGPKLNKYDTFDPTWPRPFQKYYIYIVNLLYFQIARQIWPNICFFGQYLAPGLKYLSSGLEYLGPATSNMIYLIQPDLDYYKNISFTL